MTKITADGSALAYSTYLGGADTDYARRLAVNSAGNAYVAGYTRSADFPTTTGAYRKDYIGGALDCGIPGFGGPVNCDDMFAAKFASDGSALVYSTYLGGGLDDVARGLAINDAGEAYLIGYTQSTDFPGVTRTGPGADIALAKLNVSGSELLYTVIIGSGTANAGHGIGLDNAGAVYITGSQTDLYVAKLSDGGATPPTETPTAITPTATPTDISPTATPTEVISDGHTISGNNPSRRGPGRRQRLGLWQENMARYCDHHSARLGREPDQRGNRHGNLEQRLVEHGAMHYR